jgi:hypothetical protein
MSTRILDLLKPEWEALEIQMDDESFDFNENNPLFARYTALVGIVGFKEHPGKPGRPKDDFELLTQVQVKIESMDEIIKAQEAGEIFKRTPMAPGYLQMIKDHLLHIQKTIRKVYESEAAVAG